jgi:hypothetical protein
LDVVSSQQQFAVVAEAFIAVVDSSEGQSQTEFLRELERALTRLYEAGLTLDDLDPDENSPPLDRMTSDEAAALQRRLGRKFGAHDFYAVVSDPYDLDSAPVTGSLADDVADIYRDLMKGFAELANGHVANALWQWKFDFDNHWGQHAAAAIYALYNLRSRVGGF